MQLELDDLILVTANYNPDFNVEDWKQEANKMFLANHYTQQFYQHLKNGTLTAGFCEELGDALAQCDVEPYVWVEAVEHNVKHAMENNLIYVV